MLPESLILASERDGAFWPHYFQACDFPWLRRLLDDIVRFEGRPRSELDAELRSGSGSGSDSETPPRRRSLAAYVLLAGVGRARPPAVCAGPPRVRAAVFSAAARVGPGGRELAIAGAATMLGLSPEAVVSLLLSDQRSERKVILPGRLPGPGDLALAANLALAQALVSRSRTLRLEIDGNARAVIRAIRLAGLVTRFPLPRAGARPGFVVEVSGPLSLFRHTRIYGRRLAGLLPILPWTRRYQLDARCRLRGREAVFQLRSGDPLPPGPEPRRFDSHLEADFADSFAKLAPDFELVREPQPLATPLGLVFPDFELRHRQQPERSWLLEIAGFWTPEYVTEKLRRLALLSPRRFILCLDRRRNLAADALPATARVLWYRRRVDVAALLALAREA